MAMTTIAKLLSNICLKNDAIYSATNIMTNIAVTP